MSYPMVKNKNFYITYYANKHSTFVVRKGKWTDKCKAWTSNDMKPCLTYFDINANGYRTATGGVKITYEKELN